MVYFDQILHSLYILALHTGGKIGVAISDEASPTISPAGRGQLVKMIITLESNDIF